MTNLWGKKALVVIAVFGFLAPFCFADLVFQMTTIGNPGNADDEPYWDNLHYGGVDYVYQISTYEVTVAQYTEFLNAVAASDPYGLYNPDMGEGGALSPASIVRSGTDGSYTYAAVSGAENQPVRQVSFYDGLRLCNWMANGQGSGSTESGSYDMTEGNWVTRSAGATWVLPNQDEWYKAAYYDPVNDVYYDYPNGSDSVPLAPTDETTPREMNFGDTPYWQGDQYYTSVGETTGQSPYGVYDMGGNVQEWTESFSPGGGDYRVTRGGGFFSSSASALSYSGIASYNPLVEDGGEGLRLAYIIPEPSTLLLLLSGIPLALTACMRSRRVSRS